MVAVVVEQSRKHHLESPIVKWEQEEEEAAAAVFEHLSYRDRCPAQEQYVRTLIALLRGPEGGVVVVVMMMMMGCALEPC